MKSITESGVKKIDINSSFVGGSSCPKLDWAKTGYGAKKAVTKKRASSKPKPKRTASKPKPKAKRTASKKGGACLETSFIEGGAKLKKSVIKKMSESKKRTSSKPKPKRTASKPKPKAKRSVSKKRRGGAKTEKQAETDILAAITPISTAYSVAQMGPFKIPKFGNPGVYRVGLDDNMLNDLRSQAMKSAAPFNRAVQKTIYDEDQLKPRGFASDAAEAADAAEDAGDVGEDVGDVGEDVADIFGEAAELFGLGKKNKKKRKTATKKKSTKKSTKKKVTKKKATKKKGGAKKSTKKTTKKTAKKKSTKKTTKKKTATKKKVMKKKGGNIGKFFETVWSGLKDGSLTNLFSDSTQGPSSRAQAIRDFEVTGATPAQAYQYTQSMVPRVPANRPSQPKPAPVPRRNNYSFMFGGNEYVSQDGEQHVTKKAKKEKSTDLKKAEADYRNNLKRYNIQLKSYLQDLKEQLMQSSQIRERNLSKSELAKEMKSINAKVAEIRAEIVEQTKRYTNLGLSNAYDEMFKLLVANRPKFNKNYYTPQFE